MIKRNIENEVLTYQVYQIFNESGQLYLFDAGNAAIYKIDELVLKLLDQEGEKVQTAYENLKNYITREQFDELIDNFKESGFLIENNKNNKKASTIKGLTLMLVQACNLACKYCFGSEGEYADRGKMSEKIALDAIDYLIKASGNERNLYVTFFGGEPLLCFDVIKKVVAYCKEREKATGKNFFYNMTTNGTLLNEEINNFIIQNKIGTMISIDGNKKQHNANRFDKMGNGSYDEVMDKTDALRKMGYLSARATITATNINLESVFEHLNVEGFSNVPMAPAYNLMSNEDFERYVVELEKLCNYFEELLKRDINKAKRIKVLWKAFKRIHGGGYQNTACGAGINGVAVDIHGNLFPCHRFVSNKEYILGNIYESEDERKQFIEECDIDNHEKCNKCYLRLLCSGGCPYENYIETGNIRNIYERQCIECKTIYSELIHIYLRLSEKQKESIFI